MSSRLTDSWTQPQGYTVSTMDELERLVAEKNIKKVVDPISYIADDLFELERPRALRNKRARKAYIDKVVGRGPSYGTWFHYHESDKLVRFAPQEEYFRLRTSRNRDLITIEEQQRLYHKRIAVFGLSVGSRAVESLVQSGIGNEYMIFDPDWISVTNLNRISAPFESVGSLKITQVGRRMSGIDPYIKQVHYPKGYTKKSDAVLRRMRPDVIVEEVDDMATKARIRAIAAELGIPVVMVGDVDDKVVLTVERYDKERVPPFNGTLTAKEVHRLINGTMSAKKQQTAMIKLLGIHTISLRLVSSVMNIGSELSGMAQLGATATIGGAIVADTVRDIFLDRGVKSGRRVLDTRRVVGARRTTSWKEGVSILKRFYHYRKESQK